MTTESTQEREWPPFAASLCSPTTTWVCPACGRWYQTIHQRDELSIAAKRRCTEQHIKDGCRAYTEQSANHPQSATRGGQRLAQPKRHSPRVGCDALASL